MKKYNWGIVGTGRMVEKFLNSIQGINQINILGAASRDRNRSFEIKEKYSLTKHYDSYDDLFQDKEVDVIYIATPHNSHYKYTKTALVHKKAVLCEKPITVNSKELKDLIIISHDNECFLMEAMWTRFLPVINKINQWIDENKIGEVKQVIADFGVNFEYDPNHRAFNPHLAGGALLDLGIYPIFLASMVFKIEPINIISHVFKVETGVDGITNLIFDYGDDKSALLTCCNLFQTPCEATIMGMNGMIKIPTRFVQAEKAILMNNNFKILDEFNHLEYNKGWKYEAIHVSECLEKGKKESEIMPLKESLKIMKIMDRIRKLIKLKYPFE